MLIVCMEFQPFYQNRAGVDADREFGQGAEGAARDCPFQQLPGSGVRDRGGACVVRLDGPAGRQLQGGDCLPRRTDHQLRNLSSCGAGNESHGRNRNRRASFDRAFLPATEKDLAGRNVSGFQKFHEFLNGGNELNLFLDVVNLWM